MRSRRGPRGNGGKWWRSRQACCALAHRAMQLRALWRKANVNGKEELLVLWILAGMLAAFVAAEFSSHLVYLMEHCLAWALPIFTLR